MDKDELERLIDRALMGDTEAECDLGDYYEDNDNYNEALHWYSKAAGKNSLHGMYMLASLHYDKLVDNPDIKMALELLVRCSEMKDDKNSSYAYLACADLARAYNRGLGVERDIVKAVEWYEKAEMGLGMFDDDYITMGRYYISLGDEVSLRKAAEVLEQTADYDLLVNFYTEVLPDSSKAEYYRNRKMLLNPSCFYSSLLHEQSPDYNKILEQFKNYFLNDFERDLTKFYQFVPFSGCDNIAFSLSCSKESNPKRESPKNITFFSISTFFVSLFPQLIGMRFGEKLMKDFFMATGWPWLNCGMGGLMCPISIINESSLAPTDSHIGNYVFIFEKARLFMIHEFMKFLDGGCPNMCPDAYRNIVSSCNNIDKYVLENECKVQCDIFRNWIVCRNTAFDPYLVKLRR